MRDYRLNWTLPLPKLGALVWPAAVETVDVIAAFEALDWTPEPVVAPEVETKPADDEWKTCAPPEAGWYWADSATRSSKWQRYFDGEFWCGYGLRESSLGFRREQESARAFRHGDAKCATLDFAWRRKCTPEEIA